MEQLQEVSCVVQAPVSLSVDAYGDGRSSYGKESTTTSDHCTPSHSGCQVIDVELPQPSQISIIQFRNNYTYAITVLYQSSVVPEPSMLTQGHTMNAAASKFQSHGIEGRGGEWKVGLAKHVLMPSCHCDSPEAQKWVELGQSAFQSKLEDVVRLRLILRQPSPHWRQFGIKNFSCYNRNSCAGAHPELSVVSCDHEGVWSSWNKVERFLEVGRRAHSILESEEERGGSLSSHLHNRSQPYEVNLLSTS